MRRSNVSLLRSSSRFRVPSFSLSLSLHLTLVLHPPRSPRPVIIEEGSINKRVLEAELVNRFSINLVGGCADRSLLPPMLVV